ncbi:MAG: helix-turn-helix transcriptional regulator [Candidatus Omnitrophica bacterium]|nr:helix-turn-helix transcriptional regulator [Candidatus Omnitrophota bacterium]MCK4423407.1 helix-turn-helix transcriptional regulator [Candidatus Omnitrophota bacterium]
MGKNKSKTYMDTLMADKEFSNKFKEEYQNLCISEQIAMARHAAHLTQAELANKIHTTKSAISRYENADYKNYSVSLLSRIADACNADLRVAFLAK